MIGNIADNGWLCNSKSRHVLRKDWLCLFYCFLCSRCDARVKCSFNDCSVFSAVTPVSGLSFLFPGFTDGAAINPVSMLSRITVCPNKRERLGRFSPIEFHRKPADHDRRRFATRRVLPPLPPFILSLPRFLRNPVFFPSCIDALRNAS